ncbi:MULTISPECIES: TorD/DmsD family molecular chaperone [Haloferax]|uniref:Molecular chaperone TorD family protein n=1 Tax=Haloferax sp. Atlit-48N TaxID=2077198 RepID=A0ACD5I318_9EURY|nr:MULTISPECIES: molecular chaperone TorD family protein [Haloferax]RDZ31074.1 cytoplasmic chaperone TorD family protein [Haloferax sp. Atlit-48N]RDZ38295.1 cytoplasmic chaperone TorD family protein [Haloferax sp. Atlit-47N]
MSEPAAQSPSEGNEKYEEHAAAGDAFESARTATYAVLAACWREPTERLVEVANDGELSAFFGPLESLELHALRSEYARLFIGPAGPPCPPYESVYRDRADDDEFGEVLGPATTAVERWYQAFGVEHRPEQRDLPDHVATELEFCAYLAEHGRDDRLDQFRDEHLTQWVDDLCDRVETETRSPFYAALARTTREVVSD